MKIGLTILLLSLFASDSMAFLSDKYISVFYEIKSLNEDSSELVFVIKSYADIMLPASRLCENLYPVINGHEMVVRNSDCPQYVTNSIDRSFKYLKKDSVTRFSVHISSNIIINSIKLEFEYVPTTTKEFKKLRKENIIASVTPNYEHVFFIKSEIERYIIRTAHFHFCVTAK